MEINGKKVVDATKPIRLTITAQDVKNGRTKDPGSCAAAKALIRTQPHCTKARVHLGCIYVEQPTKWVRYRTPSSIRTELVSFDRGAEFQAGDYTISPPTLYERTHHRSGSETSRTTPKHTHVARIKHHEVSGVRHGLVR